MCRHQDSLPLFVSMSLYFKLLRCVPRRARGGDHRAEAGGVWAHLPCSDLHSGTAVSLMTKPVYACPEAPPHGLQFSLFHHFFLPRGVEWPSLPAYRLGFHKYFLHFNLWMESIWTRFCFLIALVHEGAVMFANSIPPWQEASWRCRYALTR